MFVAGSRALRLACRSTRTNFPQAQLVLASYPLQALAVPRYYTSSSSAIAESRKPVDESGLPGHDGAKLVPDSNSSPVSTHNVTVRTEAQTPSKNGVIRFVTSGSWETVRKPTRRVARPRSSPDTRDQWRNRVSHIPVEVNGKQFLFESAHLRDSCACPRCIHPSTKQRTFETAQIPREIFAKKLHMEKDSLIIEWGNDIEGFEGHTSTFSTGYLQTLTKVEWSFRPADPASYWDNSKFQKTNHWISYDDYMNNDKEFRSAMAQLSRYGLLFLKGVPEDTESVSRIATRIGPVKNTFYGSTWDVRNIPNPKNVAYTNVDLGFHMDLLYLVQPPGLQFLHCMKNELPGGESLFADSFHAAKILRKTSREQFNLLTKAWMTWGYNNDDQIYSATRRVINVVSQFPGTIKDINYSPPFQMPFWNSRPGEPGSLCTRVAAALNSFKSILEDKRNIFELKMKPGECVIFQNRRVVHARRAFGDTDSQPGGDRWLRGCYIDSDVAASKFKTLKV
ncbi:putative gamma-butyrobetaine dioxygenase [Microsporum canis]|uniref:Mitochondrial protein n=1 Tax=Arthroderma otae (strain ATCC MYA-4605 / CBS 113480) TaxID=554155 RepID=C5FYM2_ARTOC|nr:mitochondrial protein [Microsporum canis CBS 113480]EEQ34620.1 mitochondrial protein [Microsporum canis CBS 113480]